MSATKKIRPKMYGLSTCGWCAKARSWLDANAGEYDLIYVDLLDEAERVKAIDSLTQAADRVAFPMVFFGDTCIVGYRPEDYAAKLEG